MENNSIDFQGLDLRFKDIEDLLLVFKEIKGGSVLIKNIGEVNLMGIYSELLEDLKYFKEQERLNNLEELKSREIIIEKGIKVKIEGQSFEIEAVRSIEDNPNYLLKVKKV